MTVDCDDTSMTVTLHSPKFEGMLYAQGHSDTCFIQGRGQNITILKMSLSANDTEKCNAHLAFAVGKINRLLLITLTKNNDSEIINYLIN